LVALVITGAIGRYLYARVPRAAGGRELELAELEARVAQWTRGFERIEPERAANVRGEIEQMIAQRRWGGTLPTRLFALVASEWSLLRILRRLGEQARAAGWTPEQRAELGRLARATHRAALVTAHFDDLRALAASWRWMHRWGALLLVLLTLFHVAHAFIYGSIRFGGGGA
jgi:dihydropyrimidine dehydrogenase (NAD+) subunit PreT